LAAGAFGENTNGGNQPRHLPYIIFYKDTVKVSGAISRSKRKELNVNATGQVSVYLAKHHMPDGCIGRNEWLREISSFQSRTQNERIAPGFPSQGRLLFE
jgi:hypothetical protein